MEKITFLDLILERLSEAGGECFAPCIQLCFCAAARRNCQKRCPGTPENPRNPEIINFRPRKNHILINFLTLLLTTLNFNTTPEKLSCYTKMMKSGAKDIILKSLSKLKLKYSMSRKLVKPWISALRATRLSEAGGECFAPCVHVCFCAAARRNA